MITVHLNYAKQRVDIWSFFPRRTDELDAVKIRNSAWQDNFVGETVVEEDWR